VSAAHPDECTDDPRAEAVRDLWTEAARDNAIRGQIDDDALNPPLPHLHRPRRRALPRVLDPRPGSNHRARRDPGRATRKH